MMRSILDALGFLECCKYNNEKELLDLSRKQVHDLENQCTEFITQIQELKAVYDYQTADLEKKIKELQQQYDLCKDEVNVLENQNCSLETECNSWKKKFFAKIKPKTAKDRK
jgi:phage shock protein A